MEGHWIRRMAVPKEEKDAMLTTSSRRFVTVLLFAAIAAAAGAAFPRAAQDKNAQDKKLGDEQEIGKQVFNELKAKTEVVKSSPLYDQLMPIAAAVTRTAQPRYGLPFKFYLVHEPGPNAFATHTPFTTTPWRSSRKSVGFNGASSAPPCCSVRPPLTCSPSH